VDRRTQRSRTAGSAGSAGGAGSGNGPRAGRRPTRRRRGDGGAGAARARSTAALAALPGVEAAIDIERGRVHAYAGVAAATAARLADLAHELGALAPPDGELCVRTRQGQVLLARRGERTLCAVAGPGVLATTLLYDLRMALDGRFPAPPATARTTAKRRDS